MSQALPYRIVLNQAQCRRCLTILVSEHDGEAQSCACRAVTVDGGTTSIRRIGKMAEMVEMSLALVDGGLRTVGPTEGNRDVTPLLAHLHSTQPVVLFDGGATEKTMALVGPNGKHVLAAPAAVFQPCPAPAQGQIYVVPDFNYAVRAGERVVGTLRVRWVHMQPFPFPYALPARKQNAASAQISPPSSEHTVLAAESIVEKLAKESSAAEASLAEVEMRTKKRIEDEVKRRVEVEIRAREQERKIAEEVERRVAAQLSKERRKKPAKPSKPPPTRPIATELDVGTAVEIAELASSTAVRDYVTVWNTLFGRLCDAVLTPIASTVLTTRRGAPAGTNWILRLPDSVDAALAALKSTDAEEFLQLAFVAFVLMRDPSARSLDCRIPVPGLKTFTAHVMPRVADVLSRDDRLQSMPEAHHYTRILEPLCAEAIEHLATHPNTW